MQKQPRPLPAFRTAFPHRAFCAAVVLLAAAGCRDNYPATVPVRGRITYDGGAWPAGGTIYFLPEKPAEAHGHHPGMASFGRDGAFTARTFTAGDGLGPGAYVVRIECWKVPPQMGGPPPESHLPPDYLSGKKSLPRLIVEPGARRVWFEYDVSSSNTKESARLPDADAALGHRATCHLRRRGPVLPAQANVLEHEAEISGGLAACPHACRTTAPLSLHSTHLRRQT